MSMRNRIHRSGVALAVMGLVLSTVDVNPAGEIPGAYAGEPAAISAAARRSRPRRRSRRRRRSGRGGSGRDGVAARQRAQSREPRPSP